MKFSLAGRLKAAILAISLGGFGVALLISNTVAGRVEAQRSGAVIYSQNCARCHGVDGRAQTTKGRQTQAVDFTSDDWTPETGHDTRIVTRGKGSMPSFKSKLTPADINAVVQYIRRFKR